MSTKLQGLAAKVAKFKHDAEFEAEKLDTKIEGAAARMPGVFSGAHGAIDGITKQVDDVNEVLTAIQAATNGAPPLEDAAPSNPTPLPPVGFPNLNAAGVVPEVK